MLTLVFACATSFAAGVLLSKFILGLVDTLRPQKKD